MDASISETSESGQKSEPTLSSKRTSIGSIVMSLGIICLNAGRTELDLILYL